MFHNRVEYPDEELINKLKRDRVQSESVNKKQTETSTRSVRNEKNFADSDEIYQTKKNKWS